MIETFKNYPLNLIIIKSDQEFVYYTFTLNCYYNSHTGYLSVSKPNFKSFGFCKLM